MIKKLLFFLPLCVLIVSAFANIIMAAHVSDVGASIHEFETRTTQLSAHDDEMLQELAGKQSLSQLKSWALAEGFVPRGQTLVVRPEAPKLASIAVQ